MPVKRRRLNRDLVVAQAAAMADAAGNLDTVTLTALAEALDVRTPSLYNHVDNLEDLHHALAVYSLNHLVETLRQAAVGAVGREALLAMANAYRRFAHEHPGLYPLTVQAPAPDDVELGVPAQTLLQMLLLVFASFGLHGDAALHAVRGLRALLHGFVSLETIGGYKMALDLDESFHRLVEIYLDGLKSSRVSI
jgi:AcrR family transcriptional regulator